MQKKERTQNKNGKVIGNNHWSLINLYLTEINKKMYVIYMLYLYNK